VRTALASIVVLVVAGCGVPQELSKQAEEIGSVAAEGSLLAHEAAEGSTTETFTREHAKALRKLVEEVEPAIEDRDLALIAAKVDAMLVALAEAPGSRRRAGLLERSLKRAADSAEELAG
jgi:hypothetical protein